METYFVGNGLAPFEKHIDLRSEISSKLWVTSGTFIVFYSCQVPKFKTSGYLP